MDVAHDRPNDAKYMYSQDDIFSLSTMNDNITQQRDKHLIMPLPLVPNNKSSALTRLDHLKRDKQYKD